MEKGRGGEEGGDQRDEDRKDKEILAYSPCFRGGVLCVCVCVSTCERTCGVPPLSLGAASLCVFLLSLGWTGRDVALRNRAPGTRGNDTAPRRCGCSKNKMLNFVVFACVTVNEQIVFSSRLTWCSSSLRGCALALSPARVSSLGVGLSPCLSCRLDGDSSPRVSSFPSWGAKEEAHLQPWVEGMHLEKLVCYFVLKRFLEMRL